MRVSSFDIHLLNTKLFKRSQILSVSLTSAFKIFSVKTFRSDKRLQPEKLHQMVALSVSSWGSLRTEVSKD